MGGPSELGDQAVSKRAKRDHDVPNARSSQHHREAHKNDVMTKKEIMQVLPKKLATKGEPVSVMLDGLSDNGQGLAQVLSEPVQA